MGNWWEWEIWQSGMSQPLLIIYETDRFYILSILIAMGQSVGAEFMRNQMEPIVIELLCKLFVCLGSRAHGWPYYFDQPGGVSYSWWWTGRQNDFYAESSYLPARAYSYGAQGTRHHDAKSQFTICSFSQAKGYEKLITALYMSTDKFLSSDAVFGVKSSLIVVKFISSNQITWHSAYKIGT